MCLFWIWCQFGCVLVVFGGWLCFVLACCDFLFG